ncbi:MAG: hypothetical protein ACI4VR_03035 [Bacilli bacterium]
MKKILFVMLCCLCLCGCGKEKTYKTSCSTSTKFFLETGVLLKSSVIHNKENFISYFDDNFYNFDSLDEAIKAENKLNEDCNAVKNEYVNCNVERENKSVSLSIKTKCYDGIDCSYEALINDYENKGMVCEDALK